MSASTIWTEISHNLGRKKEDDAAFRAAIGNGTWFGTSNASADMRTHKETFSNLPHWKGRTIVFVLLVEGLDFSLNLYEKANN